MVTTDFGELELGRMLMPKPRNAGFNFMGWRGYQTGFIGSKDAVPSNIKPEKKDDLPANNFANAVTKTQSVAIGFVQIIYEFTATNSDVFNYYTQYAGTFQNTTDTPGSETLTVWAFERIVPMTHTTGTRIIFNYYFDRL